ncbi:hypothetical protein H5410_015464 [Solanum commersonii]|uniref:Uncharacterized protein n=1 Tax=Solanum commersonii TaxID=4109 RepID=A0A9J5ZTX1_SOLCO|nr:hypothetical protein H5410_015464 [Solanum commersonii]
MKNWRSCWYYEVLSPPHPIFIGQVCQQMKDTCLKPAGYLLPLPIPAAIFEDISMNLVAGLPPSQGHSHSINHFYSTVCCGYPYYLVPSTFVGDRRIHHTNIAFSLLLLRLFMVGIPPTVARYIMDHTFNPNVAESLCCQDETLALLKSNLQASQERMNQDADKGRKMQALRLEIGCMFDYVPTGSSLFAFSAKPNSVEGSSGHLGCSIM